MSSTVSFAQTGKPNPDTVRCYGLKELRFIAATLVEARATDTLLSISKVKLANRDSLITEKSLEIKLLMEQLSLKDKIIEVKEAEIKAIDLKLTRCERQKKWIKLGWGSTTVVLGSGILYLLFK